MCTVPTELSALLHDPGQRLEHEVSALLGVQPTDEADQGHVVALGQAQLLLQCPLALRLALLHVVFVELCITTGYACRL